MNASVMPFRPFALLFFAADSGRRIYRLLPGTEKRMIYDYYGYTYPGTG